MASTASHVAAFKHGQAVRITAEHPAPHFHGLTGRFDRYMVSKVRAFVDLDPWSAARAGDSRLIVAVRYLRPLDVHAGRKHRA